MTDEEIKEQMFNAVEHLARSITLVEFEAMMHHEREVIKAMFADFINAAIANERRYMQDYIKQAMSTFAIKQSHVGGIQYPTPEEKFRSVCEPPAFTAYREVCPLCKHEHNI